MTSPADRCHVSLSMSTGSQLSASRTQISRCGNNTGAVCAEQTTLILTSDQVCHIERHLIDLRAAIEQYEGLAAYKANKRGHMSSAAPRRHSMSTHLRAIELLNIPQDADVVALHEVDCHTLQQTSTFVQPQACMLLPVKCSQCFACTHSG